MSREPMVGDIVWYFSERHPDGNELGSEISAAIVTYVYREGINNKCVSGNKVDLHVLARNGTVNIREIEFGKYQTYGRWSWKDVRS